MFCLPKTAWPPTSTITETRTDRHEEREEMANTYQPYIRLLMILE